MAIIKGVIVNDGGAPARIINLEAGEAIEAGEALKMHTDGLVMLATSNLIPVIGYALTDTAINDLVSIVTGKGCILRSY